MSESVELRTSQDGRFLMVRIPIRLKRIGGRKAMIAPPDGFELIPATTGPKTVLVKALARAFRWQRLLDARTYSSTREIAVAEKINESYVSRVLRLNLLAPELIERILNGRQVDLGSLLKPFPVDWRSQRKLLLCVQDAERE